MISAFFCVLFGLSLLPGRKPLCLGFAERISEGIIPDGAAQYCRTLTWVWFCVLLCNSAVCAASLYGPLPVWALAVAPVSVPLTLCVERHVRSRRFRTVFHTSGSTGKSKDIVKTFQSLARETAMHRSLLREVTACRPLFLSTIDPSHMYGVLWRVMLPRACGCEVDPEIILTPESLVAKMRSARKVFLVTTPSFLARFTAYADQYDVPGNCVEVVTSGALLTAEVSRRTKEVFGIAPREIFGSTETGGVAWRRQDEFSEWRVFEPVRIASSGGRLLVRSPFSFKRTYVMGDGAEIADDGRSFRLLGRMDRLVKINEERVNLSEMEDKVRSAGYRDCALAVLDRDKGAFLGMVIAGEKEKALEIRAKMQKIFPKGTVPRRYRYVREIPRNNQGKVVAARIVELLEKGDD